jgi:hypothetical protein
VLDDDTLPLEGQPHQLAVTAPEGLDNLFALEPAEVEFIADGGVEGIDGRAPDGLQYGSKT